ncbi:MAG: RluA family pseudouridine synthase [Myxococcales bacterium]|nr:RluA family pseudouridine synthase [Myxococcales bacterium]
MSSKHTVTEALAGQRLDKALVALAEGASRAKVKAAIEDGRVRVNGRRCAKGALVAAGDVIDVEVEIERGDAPCIPEDAPLDVRYESEHVVVVYKPAGQPTAPLKRGETGALANALVGKYPEMASIGYSPREPGLIHRLDTDTSGLLVAARDAATLDALREALQAGTLEKSYLLVCASEDLPDVGTIAHPIANHPKDKRRVLVCAHPRDVMRNDPRPATTHFTVERRSGPWALVRAEAPKALRHQIRAHFASIDHPLAGDVLYGGPAVEGLTRHALHAARVALQSGRPETTFDVSAPLPDDLERLLT